MRLRMKLTSFFYQDRCGFDDDALVLTLKLYSLFLLQIGEPYTPYIMIQNNT